MKAEKEFDPKKLMTTNAGQLIKMASLAAQIEKNTCDLIASLLEICEENPKEDN